MAKPLEQVLGVTKDHYWRNHFNYNTWADDIEMQDFWSDAIADIVRGPNVVLDAWYSQLVENRVLRNFGMHYYNSNIEGFQPQTFNPVPWGWYGIPLTQGQRISDILQKVEIPELSESLDEMQYVMEMAEKATGATATQQGEIQQRQVTLGEVQLALGEAKERIKGMSKFYTQVWRDRAKKFLKLIEGSADKLDVIDLYKKGRNTDAIYKRTIDPTKDLLTDSGYSTRIWSQDDKNETDSKKLERLNAAIANMPNNNRLKEEFQRSLLEFAGLSPEKINEIVEEENQKMKMMTAFANQTMTAQGITPPGTQPTTPSQVATPSNL